MTVTLDNFNRAASEVSPYKLQNHTADNSSTWSKIYGKDAFLNPDGILSFDVSSTDLSWYENQTNFTAPDFEAFLTFKVLGPGAQSIGIGGRYTNSLGGVYIEISNTTQPRLSLLQTFPNSQLLTSLVLKEPLQSNIFYQLSIAFKGGSVKCYLQKLSDKRYCDGNGDFLVTSKVDCITYNNLTITDTGKLFILGTITSGISVVQVDSVTFSYEFAAEAFNLIVPATDSKIFSSPCNWFLEGSNLVSVNPGAYLKIAFVGESLSLDLSPRTNAVNIRISVDNKNPKNFDISGGTTRLQIVNGLKHESHSVDIRFMRRNFFVDGWFQSSTGERLEIKSIEVTSFASQPTLLNVKKNPRSCLIYGDSITEGVYQTLDFPQGSSSSTAYSTLLGEALDSEYGIIAWAGQGWTTPSGARVPNFLNSWNFHKDGVPRDFSKIKLDYVIINMGANDAFQAKSLSPTDFTTFLAAFRQAVGPDTLFIFINPFAGVFTSDLVNGIANYLSAHKDSNVKMIDLGIFGKSGLTPTEGASLYSVDAVHPNQEGHARLSSALTKEIYKFITKTGAWGSFAGVPIA